jgi:hypothetical protein
MSQLPPPPESALAAFNDIKRDRLMFRATLHFIIVITVAGIGLYMPTKAEKWTRAQLESKEKRVVEVLCSDDSIIKGNYVLALGEAIVVDLENNGQSQRILIRQDQIRRIIKHLPADEKPAVVHEIIPAPAPSPDPS